MGHIFFQHIVRPIAAVTLAMLIMVAVDGPVRAQLFNVNLDLTGLQVGDTYAVDFQLNQGDPTNAISTASIGSFVYGPGGGSGAPASIFSSGNTVGNLASTVTLSTSGSAFNEFSQDINGGAPGLFGFTVDISALGVPTPTSAGADQFVFSIYDVTTSTSLATNGPNTFELFTITKDTAGASQVQTYGYTNGGTTYTTTSNGAAPAPELSTWVTFGMLLVMMFFAIARNRRAPVATVP
ncbi:MAG TPA: hypothetical protein VGK19_20730 [Capsulimonadaceae bacterium]|jgi:hypothetical protein